MANENPVTPPKPSVSEDRLLELSNSIAGLNVEIQSLKKGGFSKEELEALKTELSALKTEYAALKKGFTPTPSAPLAQSPKPESGHWSAGFWDPNIHE